MYERLALLRESEKDVATLQKLHLVSNRYDFRNLALDMWYIRTMKSRAVQDVSNCYDREDPLKGIWLKCILLALNDVKSGRPCDLEAWRKDSPPMGIDTCSKNLHICAPAAMGFLLALPEEHERFISVTPGTLKDLVKRLRCKN
jgi:hypothetical protein